MVQIVDYDPDDHRLHVRIGSEERVHDDVPRWLVDRLRTVADPLGRYRRRIAGHPDRYPVVATPRAP